jgi:hypothetical protein
VSVNVENIGPWSVSEGSIVNKIKRKGSQVKNKKRDGPQFHTTPPSPPGGFDIMFFSIIITVYENALVCHDKTVVRLLGGV